MFRHIPLAKKVYRTRLWLRSESNISVIEHGSDKTKEFKDIALKVLESTVTDEELRRRLTPDHPLGGCKRLVFAGDYLATLTKPHVQVIASPARALRGGRTLVTEDGTELDVDVVLCATGYAAADYLGQIDVVGEHGVSLRDTWRDGAHAYLGMAVPGFPNFFSCCTGPTPTSAPIACCSCSRRRPTTSCGRWHTCVAAAGPISRCGRR